MRAGIGTQIPDGLPFGAADVDGLRVERRDVLEARLLLPPVPEIVNAHAHELHALRGAVAEHRHQPVGALEGQSFHRDVDDAEHRGRQADAERQRDDGRGAEARPPDQRADAVSDVAENRAHRALPRTWCRTVPVLDEDGCGEVVSIRSRRSAPGRCSGEAGQHVHGIHPDVLDGVAALHHEQASARARRQSGRRSSENPRCGAGTARSGRARRCPRPARRRARRVETPPPSRTHRRARDRRRPRWSRAGADSCA